MCDDEISPGDRKLIKDFRAFHAANPHVYKMFCDFALQAASRRPHFSSRAIIHRMRWETMIQTDDDRFKISDHHSPFYARMFEFDYPQHKGFFAKRPGAADIPLEPE